MSIAVTRTSKRKVQLGTIAEAGFDMPPLPAMPADPGHGAILSTEDQHALGYRIMISQIGLMTAMCAHTDVVSMLLADVKEVLSSGAPVGQALALIKVGSKWVRAESIPTDEFKALALRKIKSVEEALAELADCENVVSDLFSMALRDELASRMAEILPYDKILFKAADCFRAQCRDLEVECRKLVGFLSSELKLPRPKVKAMIGEAWVSAGLISTVNTSVYEVALYPAKAKKALRDNLLSHQRAIQEIVRQSSSSAGDLLAAWSAFNAQDRILKGSVSLMYERNRSLVEALVKQYRHVGDESQIRSAGDMGLLRAIYRFAPEMGYRFSTIGTQWIKQMIVRELQQQDLIRLPEGSQANLFAIRAVLSENPNASKAEIAQITGLKTDDVANLLYFVGGTGGISLDAAFQDAGSSETEGLHEILADSNSQFETHVDEEDSAAFVERALKETLTGRHLDIVCAQFGIGMPEQSLKEIGARLGMSMERVRQVREEAIVKLKSSKYFDDLMTLWG